MRGIAWIAVAVGLAVSGCFETPQEVLDDIACSKLCSCLVIASCEEQCLQALAPVSQECFDLTTTHAQNCALLEASLETGGACLPSGPDPTEN